MTKSRIFFDASVIISAILSPTGGSAKFINLAQNKRIVAITSQTVIDEVTDHKDKINKSTEEIFSYIKDSRMIVRERVTQAEIKTVSSVIDSTDAHLLVGARGAKCHYLLTLDKKHLLRADVRKNVSPLRIVNPKELLGILNATGRK